MTDTLLMRSIRWLVDRQRERLARLDALADLAPFRMTVEQVRRVRDASPKVLEAATLLEAEISERERVQERARRVLSDGNASHTCKQKQTRLE